MNAQMTYFQMSIEINLTHAQNAWRGVGIKQKKPKDNTKGRKRAGRQRRHSVPDYLTGEDWTANKDKIAKSIGTKIKSKRNIEEVGSPEKTETKLEEKKKEGG